MDSTLLVVCRVLSAALTLISSAAPSHASPRAATASPLRTVQASAPSRATPARAYGELSTPGFEVLPLESTARQAVRVLPAPIVQRAGAQPSRATPRLVLTAQLDTGVVTTAIQGTSRSQSRALLASVLRTVQGTAPARGLVPRAYGELSSEPAVVTNLDGRSVAGSRLLGAASTMRYGATAVVAQARVLGTLTAEIGTTPTLASYTRALAGRAVGDLTLYYDGSLIVSTGGVAFGALSVRTVTVDLEGRSISSSPVAVTADVLRTVQPVAPARHTGARAFGSLVLQNRATLVSSVAAHGLAGQTGMVLYYDGSTSIGGPAVATGNLPQPPGEAFTLPITSVAVTITPTAVSLYREIPLPVTAAAVTIDPVDVGVVVARPLPITPAAVALTTQPITLGTSYLVVFEAAQVAIAADLVGITALRHLPITAANTAITPVALTLRFSESSDLLIAAAELTLDTTGITIRKRDAATSDPGERTVVAEEIITGYTRVGTTDIAHYYLELTVSE